MSLIKVEYLIESEYKEVHDVAHAMLTETLSAGEADNGTASHWNRDPLLYHLWKALHHLLRLWNDQDIEAREKDAPRLKHLYNGFTRIALAEAGRLKRLKIGSGLTIGTTQAEVAGE